ncbi:MAG TPA: hypothetical protein VLL73_02490 [Desulfurivibrionaceae bacterium]|nr:hypothetical protein [Desulfurivibrionaceae bacterium]
MSHQALIEELRRQGEAGKRAIWQAAEAEAVDYRAQAEQRWAAEQAAAEQELRATCEARAREIRLAAEQEGRQLTGQAEIALAEQLHRIARRVMPVLQDEVRGEVFVQLAKELPDRPWTRVHVNPSDLAWAREFFPQAEVVADGDISGGVEALDRQGGLRVINTLEKRLERGWDGIVAAVFAALRSLADDRPAR